MHTAIRNNWVCGMRFTLKEWRAMISGPTEKELEIQEWEHKFSDLPTTKRTKLKKGMQELKEKNKPIRVKPLNKQWQPHTVQDDSYIDDDEMFDEYLS